MTIRRLGRILTTLTVALLLARPALAGPPLLCFPFAIGAAKSLPFGTAGWRDTDPKYDASHVVADTLALLTPQTPVIVRMETIRRATVYVSKDHKRAAELLDQLQQRAGVADVNASLAVFDFGYLVETYKQASSLGMPTSSVQAINGYELIVKASAMRGDPQMEFALAVMTRDKTRTVEVYQKHLERVLTAAPGDAAIRANLEPQFGTR